MKKFHEEVLGASLIQIGVRTSQEFRAATETTEIVPRAIVEAPGTHLRVYFRCSVHGLACTRPGFILVDFFAAHWILGHKVFLLNYDGFIGCL